MAEDLKKLIEKLNESLDKEYGASIESIQDEVLEILKLSRAGEDIGDAILVLKRASNNHSCDHGCPIEVNVAEALAYQYRRHGDKKELEAMLNSSYKEKMGVLNTLWYVSEGAEMFIPLMINKLADEETNIRISAYVENVKEIIKLCKSMLK
jgi:hypothetical protein